MSTSLNAAGVHQARVSPWRRLGGALNMQWLVIGVCLLAVAYLALMPLGFLIWQSFFTPDTAEEASRFTLENYGRAYGSTETLHLLGNSLVFACGTAVFAFVVG